MILLEGRLGATGRDELIELFDLMPGRYVPDSRLSGILESASAKSSNFRMIETAGVSVFTAPVKYPVKCRDGEAAYGQSCPE